LSLGFDDVFIIVIMIMLSISYFLVCKSTVGNPS